MASESALRRFVLDPAEAQPTAEAVRDAGSGEVVTREALAARVRRAAARLAAAGVRPEERILLALVDRSAFLEAFWGTMYLGAIPVPMSTLLPEGDYAFVLADARAVGLVFSPELDGTAGAAGRAALAVPEAAGRTLRFVLEEDELTRSPEAAPSPPPLFPAADDDDAYWLYTSGTTGFPKAARHRHADLAFCTDAYAVGVLGMGPEDRCYSVAKLFFAYGLGNAGYFPAGTGASAVLNPRRPDPLAVAEHVRDHEVTLFFAVPTFYAALLRADLPDDAFRSVRLAVSAGEALPAELFRRFRQRFGVEILDGIGTTELGHIFLSNRPGNAMPGSSGTPVTGYEVVLRDDAGDPVPDGELGNLWVAGESVTAGYFRRTALNRTVLQGRFMRTGDVYVRDPAGHFVYQGRTDDMLKVGGIWVSPAEVEACITEMEDIVECAVVGREDTAGLVKPEAFVVPGEACDRDTLGDRVQAHVKARLAPYKYPRWVAVVDDLPKTATGKIQRFKLRDRTDGARPGAGP